MMGSDIVQVANYVGHRLHVSCLPNGQKCTLSIFYKSA